MSDNNEQGGQKLAQAQAQVGEVVDIMRVNVEKVLERDSKLSELDQRADNLQEGASQFQTQVNARRHSLFLFSSISSNKTMCSIFPNYFYVLNNDIYCRQPSLRENIGGRI